MNKSHLTRAASLCLFATLVSLLPMASQGQDLGRTQDHLFADGTSWPGRIFSVESSNALLHWQRPTSGSDRIVPRVQSLTFLQDGSLVVCSGLDRSVFLIDSSGERELHHGGGLVRQVRTDTNGDLYWSGLETPLDGNALPDGFVYRRLAASGQVETVLTFSQELVHRDWWGAFDVRDGQVFVATLSSPSKIYQLENSIPKLITTLPISAKSFRFESPTDLMATDGTGRLYRFTDLSQPENFQVITDGPFRFIDFARKPTSRHRQF
jgi:WD40 repeat protein